MGAPARRRAPRTRRDERLVRARGAGRYGHRRCSPRGREGVDHHDSPGRRLEQDRALLSPSSRRALLRPRRALCERRPSRPLALFVGRGRRARGRRRQAARRGDSLSERPVDDVFPGPVLPLQREAEVWGVATARPVGRSRGSRGVHRRPARRDPRAAREAARAGVPRHPHEQNAKRRTPREGRRLRGEGARRRPRITRGGAWAGGNRCAERGSRRG